MLVPTLLRDTAGSGAVLVGGAIQLAVLFMSGNSFGSDGPPVTHELLAGAGPSMLARGKARSIAIVAAPLVVIGPVLAAAITREWGYLAAGLVVGVGALLAGTGGGHRAVGARADRDPRLGQSVRQRRDGQGDDGRRCSWCRARRAGAGHAARGAGADLGQRHGSVDAGDRVRRGDGGGRVGRDAGRDHVLGPDGLRGHEPEFITAITPSR